jgi:nucleoside-diphosphate-sugar epimerase
VIHLAALSGVAQCWRRLRIKHVNFLGTRSLLGP